MQKKSGRGKTYDVVVVGAGIAGAILAKVLGDQKKRVLVLEAGRATSMTVEGYRSYLEAFYTALAKVPDSAYPNNPSAPQQDSIHMNPIRPGTPDLSGYFVQKGPLPFASDYVRAKGGTTLHWLGTCLRMVPNDFRMKSCYGQAGDWPISYRQLIPYYEKAEREIGVSADVDEQRVHGITFRKNYQYPMHSIPPSYLDTVLKKHLQVPGFDVKMPGQSRRLSIQFSTTPQGRNSIPRGRYGPVGHTGDDNLGQRCEGNSSCVPICPVQAKYNALKTLKKVNSDYVEIRCQAVASKIEIDPDSGRVTGITYIPYDDENGPAGKPVTVHAKIYVIAAHSVETAKLLLASQACRTSGEVGRNLMDHIEILTWGLMPDLRILPSGRKRGIGPIGSFRGPGSTTNIYSFRDGEFRREHSAFIVPINNWGWNWPTFSPGSDLVRFLDGRPRVNSKKGRVYFGEELRKRLYDRVSKQFCLQFELEQIPDARNRVTIDRAYKDQLGNFRPVISYNISEYVLKAMPAAKRISDQIFKHIKAKDFTDYKPTDAGYLTYLGKGYTYRGAGHLVGTHRMGTSKFNSVVNREQRTWDHENLFLVGCGNMPTLGTSNPTLTMAALTFWAAKNILRELNR